MTRDDVPEKYRGVYDRALAGKSRKAAVRAFCLMCVGWKRVEVDRCTVKSCPLRPYRPKARSSGQNDAKPRLCGPRVPPKRAASKRYRAR